MRPVKMSIAVAFVGLSFITGYVVGIHGMLARVQEARELGRGDVIAHQLRHRGATDCRILIPPGVTTLPGPEMRTTFRSADP